MSELIMQFQDLEINSIQQLNGIADILFNKIIDEKNKIDLIPWLVEILQFVYIPHNLCINESQTHINMRSLILEKCQKNFTEFVDSKKMTNIIETVTLIGLLYVNNIIPEIIITNCITILFNKLKNFEDYVIGTLTTLLSIIVLDDKIINKISTIKYVDEKLIIDINTYLDRLITNTKMSKKDKFMIMDYIEAYNKFMPF